MREEDIDRLAIRRRPPGSPLMYQSWNQLLFLHWQVPEEALRALIPDRLSLDTYNGKARIAVTACAVRNSRPVFTPPLPWVGDFNEINVRTYVHLGGVPGVWFFSLDANSLVAVMGARMFFHLPYHVAEIEQSREANAISYQSRREDQTATFRTNWRIGEMIGQATTGTLEFFFVERYCLYTADGATLYRCRIHHQPWILREAELSSLQSTMIEAQGLAEPSAKPWMRRSGNCPRNTA